MNDWFSAQACIVPHDCDSLQRRLDCARPGDTIRVSGGRFTKGLNVPDGVNLELTDCVFETVTGVLPPAIKQYFNRSLLSTPMPSVRFRRYPDLTTPGAPPIGKQWHDNSTGITYVYRGAYNNEPSWQPIDEYFGGALR